MSKLFLVGIFLLFSGAILAQEDNYVKIKGVTVSGNAKTKKDIILRELTFSIGDSLPATSLFSKLERSRQNIFNLKLFNFVSATIDTVSSSEVSITYTVIERWYLWPAPIFEYVDPNFNTWVKSKDLRRVNAGLEVSHENFRGRNEKLKIKAKFGYNDAVEIFYSKPYINKAKTIGLALGVGYQQRYEVNYGLRENKRLLHAKPGEVVRQLSFANAEIFYRPKQYFKAYALTQFKAINVQDSILSKNIDYLPSKANSTKYIGMRLGFVYDKRNRAAYPSKGFRISSEVYKPSFGLLKANVNKVLISTSTLSNYIPFTNRISLGLGAKYIKTWYTDALPYIWQQSLGYNNEIRGYEYYIIDGDNLLSLKSNINTCLIKPKNFNIGFINDERFSKLFLGLNLNVFFDAAYAQNKLDIYNNPLLNTWQYGYGVGLDLTSYYDKVFRVDCAWNRQGDFGLYLHFTKPL